MPRFKGSVFLFAWTCLCVSTLLSCREITSTSSAPVSLNPTTQKTAADWQLTLENHFDMAETFDALRDWDGSVVPNGYSWSTTTSGGLPKKADGSSSRWSYTTVSHKAIEITAPIGSFSKLDIVSGSISGAKAGIASVRTEAGKHYLVLGYGTGTNSLSFQPNELLSNGTGATATVVRYVKWIGYHGPDYVWQGAGKSLCINYGDFTAGGSVNSEYPDNVAGFGPSRLGTFFGDGLTGKSGYKKIHVFMMAKLAPGFVKKDPGTGKYIYIGTVKMFDLVSGFTAPDKWGTPAEAALVSSEINNINEYGLNFYIFNLFGTGSYGERLFYAENAFTAIYKTTENPGWAMNQVVGNRPLSSTSMNDNDITSFYEAGSWYGIEVAADIGTLGGADATLESWIYDSNGVERGHFSESGNNRLLQFDHLYNKVVLGGNRICTGYGTCPLGQDNRWYADDFIIHGSRIGPNYFRLLEQNESGR